MPKTRDNADVFSVQYGLDERQETNWSECEQALIDREKGWFESRVSGLNINFESNTLGVVRDNVPATYPINSKGRKSLLETLSLDEVEKTFQLVADPSDDVKDAKNTLWQALLTQQADRNLRIHLGVNAVFEKVGYVSTTRFKTLSETGLFKMVADVSKLFDFQLRRFIVDEDSVRFQVIQTRNPVDDPSQPGGKIMGLIDLVLSETNQKNDVTLGFYQSECRNGVLYGQNDALTISAAKGAKAASPFLIKAMFEAAEAMTINRADRMERATQIVYGFEAHNMLEAIIADPKHSCKISYNSLLKDRIDVMREQAKSLADVVNEITRVGHLENVPIHEQLKLERVGGTMLERLIAV